MRSRRLFGGGKGTLLVGGAVAGLAALAMTFGTAGTALAQSGAPGPGWIQTPGGGWVPPDHPLATIAPPAGPGHCGLHTLRGSYVFAATGYNIVGGMAQPKAIVEAIDFHGNGTLGVPAVTVSINGFINRLSPAPGGEYTLGAACVGTLSFTGGPSFDIFVDPTGKEGWMIQTNPNTVFQGTVTQISR